MAPEILRREGCGQLPAAFAEYFHRVLALLVVEKLKKICKKQKFFPACVKFARPVNARVLFSCATEDPDRCRTRIFTLRT